ncbi:unnamed protein product [Rhizophagus irregularis]|nr:unnamed protein product [Rhizophagus irregularis]CAB5373466.1 unnamed protein product [Rhizophagus irregularis]
MQVYSSYCSILQALLLTHIHFYSSASYTFQEEIGIALVEDKSGFAGIIEIVKLHGNDGQDYIFTYCLFEDVSRLVSTADHHKTSKFEYVRNFIFGNIIIIVGKI